MPRFSTYVHVLRFSLSTLLLAAAAGFASPPAGAQTFAPTVNISNSGADSSSSQMAVVSPNVYVTWQDSQGSQGPRFSRSTDSGQTFSAPIEIFTGGTQGQIGPYIAATGANVYVARSVRLKPKQPTQVFFKRSTNNGVSFGNQVQVSSGNGASLAAMATAGANVYLVWFQPAPANPDVFFARSTNGGMTFGTPVNLSNSSAFIDSVTLAAEGAGVHVAWSEEVGAGTREIFYRQSTDGGSTFGGASNVSNSAASSAFPHIAVSGPNVYLAWTEAEIRFSASNDGGTSFSAPVDLSSGMSDSCQGGGPRLAASGNAVQVIWHSDHLGNCEVFHRASADGGATFNAESNISNSAQHSLGGVVTANGANVLIAWSDALPSGEIYLVHSGDNGATFGAQVNVSISSGESRNPRLAIASPTQIHAIWLDRTPGNWDVFSARGTLP